MSVAFGGLAGAAIPGAILASPPNVALGIFVGASVLGAIPAAGALADLANIVIIVILLR